MPPSGLHGRTTELAWLRSLWEAATARDASGRFVGGPRMAVIAAETGYGKTRLVQALYQQLTEDPAWDPAEINYWPDAFQAPGEQLRVNPDPEGHVPKGPPQFLWLGMRWQPTDVRNVDDRACALPAARDALQVHVAIADRHRPAWQHARAELERSVRRGGIVSSLARAADLAVPFGELGVRLVKGAADLARDRASARRDAGAERDQQSSDASGEFLAELREVFGGTGSAGRVLPTVLWLDDAQWIDGTTLRFVQELWQEARRRSWPLLIAVTHWEREWEELRAAGEGLAALEDESNVEVLRLSGSARDDLAGYLAERLPGITAAQRELLLDKAGGNFLTMVENVGELLAHREAFVGSSLDGALTPDGERFVQEWESDRQRRVEQRFSRLASEVRTVLGWGSALGIRFLKDVVADHALRTGLSKDPGLVIASCVSPFAILGTPSPNVREFRDRAFHVVARKHFERWGGTQAASLRDTLREHLVRWVNGSFDGEGGVLRPDDADGVGSDSPAAIFLGAEERRDLLGMAAKELPLPGVSDWRDPAHAAALRARILLTWTDELERLHERVRRTANTLSDVDWRTVPPTVIDFGDRFLCARDWTEAGALNAARGVLVHLAEHVRADWAEDPGEATEARFCVVLAALRDVESSIGAKPRARDLAREIVAAEEARTLRERSPDAERDLAIALLDLSDLEMALDDLGASREACRRSLGIRERLLGDEPSPDQLRDVSVALDQLGHLDTMVGDDASAGRHYRRSLAIARRIAAGIDAPQARQDVAISLMNVADVVSRTEGPAEALELLREALGIIRARAAEDDHPERQEDLAHVLELVGDAEGELDRLDDAWARFEESLALRRALADDAPSQSRLRGISTVLSSMTAIAERREDPATALELATEALELDRAAARTLRTSKTLRDLGVALMTVARLSLELELEPEIALGHAREALDVRREALAASDLPLHRADLWETHRFITRTCMGARDGSVLEPAAQWLDYHRRLGDESAKLGVSTLAMATAWAALVESTCGSPTSAARRASEALELLGPRTPAQDDPRSLEITARLMSNAVIVTCLVELGSDWNEAGPYLKEALDLAKILDAATRAEDALEPGPWDATGCCLAFKAAEECFRSRGDERSAERASALVSRWERFLEEAD